MKKFTKLFLSCAAVAAITAAVATSAMAADITGALTGTYDNGKVTVTAPADMDTAKEATLLVYDASADVTNISDTAIVGIDQSEAGAAFANSGLKGAPTADDGVKYVVALGYYDNSGVFKTVKGNLFGGNVLIGDVNLDTDIDLSDATQIVKEYVNPFLTGDALAAADVNQDADVDLSDATCIVKYYVDPNGTGIGSAGQTL